LFAKERETGMKQQKADRRSQRTYHLVSSAFVELQLEKPYEDILDRAGIGRTTFYAHYCDKDDVLESVTGQILEEFTHQIARSPARQRVVPSLELFEHIYQSPHRHLRVLMRGHASEHLWQALQTALCRAIEPALSTLCAEKRSPPISLPVVSLYLASAFLTLRKWWLGADMPYPPEQMENVFQQLALPGVWPMLKE
jgi:AcrR family transcriptional regulator